MDPNIQPKDIKFLRDDSQIQKIEELNEIISMLKHKYANPDIGASKKFMLGLIRASNVIKQKKEEEEAEKKRIESEKKRIAAKNKLIAAKRKKTKGEKKNIINPDMGGKKSILPAAPGPDVLGSVELPKEEDLDERKKEGYQSSVINADVKEKEKVVMHDKPVNLTGDMSISGSKSDSLDEDDVPRPDSEVMGSLPMHGHGLKGGSGLPMPVLGSEGDVDVDDDMPMPGPGLKGGSGLLMPGPVSEGGGGLPMPGPVSEGGGGLPMPDPGSEGMGSLPMSDSESKEEDSLPISIPKSNIPGIEEFMPDSSNDDQVFTLDKEYPFVIFRDSTGRVLAQTEIEHEGEDLLYNLQEPAVDASLVKTAKELILNKFKKDKNILKDNSFVNKMIKKAFSKRGIEFTDDYREEVRYFLFRDLVGVGMVDPFLHDPNVVGVICNGVGKYLRIIFAPNSKMRSNVVFKNHYDLDRQINLLATKIGKTINENSPVAQGKYFDFDVSLTLGVGGSSSKFTMKR